MNFLQQTMKYLFVEGKGKRFFLLWLFLLPACVLVGFFFPTSVYPDLFAKFQTGYSPTFSALWYDSFNCSGWSFLSLGIAIILFVFGGGYICAIVTRHIRVGKLTFPNFFRAVNNTFFPALAVTFFFLLVTTVAHVLFVVQAYIWLQLSSRVLGLVMSILFFVLILIGMAYLLCSTTLWLPTMIFSGQYVFQALSVAFYKSRNHQRKFFLPCLIAVAIAIGVGVAGHFITPWYVGRLLHVFVYSIVLTIAVVFSFISYCEAESVRREDLAQTYFGR